MMRKIKSLNASDKPMWDIWMSIYQLSTVTVADEIGLFQALKKNKTHIDALAKILGISNHATEIITNVLVGLGFLINKNRKLNLSPTSKSYLIPDSLFYWGAQLHGLRNKPEHKLLMYAIKNGNNQLSFGNNSFTDMWESGSVTQDAAYDFTKKMHATIFAPALGAVKTGIFSTTKKLLDMGGGSGCFSIAYVKQHPKSRATVFELPAVCQVTKEYLKDFDATDKISVVSGNFFKTDWPTGYDGILFSQIFHDWQREHCEYLAKQAYSALPPGGQIFIHEMLLDDSKSTPLTVACFNMLMFINHQSQQFTKNELFALLRSTGFKRPKMKKTFGYYSIISAIK
jgi:precorrin-6B methylase 2